MDKEDIYRRVSDPLLQQILLSTPAPTISGHLRRFFGLVESSVRKLGDVEKFSEENPEMADELQQVLADKLPMRGELARALTVHFGFEDMGFLMRLQDYKPRPVNQ